jgi:hypothetical protein
MRQLYVIECRKPDGSLDFAEPQPWQVFGKKAITGIDDDEMAKVVFAKGPHDVVLEGGHIGRWPAFIDPRWSARRKYW